MDSRLARRLGVGDAVVVGLASMLGAGVFTAFGPAARAAGAGVVPALALAGLVAWCNATSSAALAAVHPESGGTYVYARRRLGVPWGVLAGGAFIAGKVASCAAMALTAGAYAAPDAARPVALAVVLVLTVVNLAGVTRTVRVTRVLLAVVLAVLAGVVVACLAGGEAGATRLDAGLGDGGALGLLEAAGILFFAFAGYARVATLGEEVVDPARTIPRAVPLALGIALAVYAVVLMATLAVLGPTGLAATDAPLAAAVDAGRFDELVPVVRAGAVVASLGVLVALLAGVARTTFAMAADGVLPRRLAAVRDRTAVPAAAVVVVGAAVAILVAVADLQGALRASSALVLLYYALTNASALRLRPAERRWPRGWAVLGLAGCAALSVSLVVGAG
ncbi:MAG TPA: APC family permease [Acidimicrobiales bacterium]|nr:APC family permease [Acidimicrobiales bacterium]